MFLIDPNSRLDFTIDWSGWLRTDETIESHTITAVGVTVDEHSEAAGVVTVWVKDGVPGVRLSDGKSSAAVTCHVVTDAGREDDRTLRFIVQER